MALPWIFLPGALLAEPLSFLDGNILFKPPAGHCRFEPGSAAEKDLAAQLSEAISQGNRVLALFAECDQLAAWRNEQGREVTEFGALLGVIQYGRIVYRPRASRAQLVDEMRQFYPQFDLADAERAIRQAGSLRRAQGRQGGIDPLGMVDRNEDAAFLASVRQQSADGGEAARAMVSGVTILNGYVVAVTLAAPYRSEESFARLLDRDKGAISRLVRLSEPKLH